MGFWDLIEALLSNAALHRFLKRIGLLTEDEEALKYATAFLSAAIHGDVGAMGSLFAVNAIEELGEDSFRDLLEAFVAYFEGGNINVEPLVGVYSAGHRSNRKYSRELRAPFDVMTDANQYRMTMKCIVRDDWEADNIGIWSISMIERSQDTDLEYAYQGDAKFRTGIHFDGPRPVG